MSKKHHVAIILLFLSLVSGCETRDSLPHAADPEGAWAHYHCKCIKMQKDRVKPVYDGFFKRLTQEVLCGRSNTLRWKIGNCYKKC